MYVVIGDIIYPNHNEEVSFAVKKRVIQTFLLAEQVFG